MTPMPNPFVFESAVSDSPSAADTAVASLTPQASGAAAVTNSVPTSSQTLPVLEVGNLAVSSDAAVFSFDEVTELLSGYAARRSPRNIDDIALGAVRSALNLHPRDLDLDPPPLFLRKPSPAFLRSLYQLAGVNP